MNQPVPSLQDRIEAAVGHALQSLWVTACAITLALAVAAGAAGATKDVPTLWAFVKAQWLTVVLIQVIAPSIRAYIGAKGAIAS